MITVLYICSDPTMGGSTASLYNLIQSVKKDVYPIVLFSSKGKGMDFFIAQGIECYACPFIILYGLHKNNLAMVWRKPWQWHYIKKWRFDHRCLHFIMRRLYGRHIDIVHTNVCPVDIGVSIAKKMHAKHVWHIREFIDKDFHLDVYNGLTTLRQQINQADAIIAISSAIAEHHHLAKDKTYIINDAIRSQSEICYFPNKEKYILFISYNLTKEKGVFWAISAFEKSGLANQNYKLKLVGNILEYCANELDIAIRQTNCASSIELMPCQTNVKPIFARASAFVMASEWEGLGRVTAEAMFFGCPVIARATGGTLDIVKEKETGYLFNTIEECAQLMRYVCTNDQYEIIHNAQIFVCQHLSQEVYGPKIMQVYHKLLQQ